MSGSGRAPNLVGKHEIGKASSGALKQPFIWIRLLLGMVFIFASVDKIMQPAEFARIVSNYQLLPGAFVNGVAIMLPWLELFLGCFLIMGRWLPGTVFLCNLLLITFFATLILNVVHGLDVHCGCFSTSTAGAPNTLWYFIRDGAFLLMGGFLFHRTFLER